MRQLFAVDPLVIESFLLSNRGVPTRLSTDCGSVCGPRAEVWVEETNALGKITMDHDGIQDVPAWAVRPQRWLIADRRGLRTVAVRCAVF